MSRAGETMLLCWVQSKHPHSVLVQEFTLGMCIALNGGMF